MRPTPTDFEAAAEFRAAVLGLLHRDPTPRSTREIVDLAMPSYGIQKASYQLRQMVRNGQIQSEGKPRGKQLYFVLEDPERDTDELGYAVPPAEAPVRAQAPVIRLDYVKSSGRMRFTLSGITFEIGVAND